MQVPPRTVVTVFPPAEAVEAKLRAFDAEAARLGQSVRRILAATLSALFGVPDVLLTPSGRGRGIGAAAVDTATRWAFDVIGLARIELFHAVENEASCRLATRCGYLLEGTARQSFVCGDGLRHDEHLHARLASDAVAALAPAADQGP